MGRVDRPTERQTRRGINGRCPDYGDRTTGGSLVGATTATGDGAEGGRPAAGRAEAGPAPTHAPATHPPPRPPPPPPPPTVGLEARQTWQARRRPRANRSRPRPCCEGRRVGGRAPGQEHMESPAPGVGPPGPHHAPHPSLPPGDVDTTARRERGVRSGRQWRPVHRHGHGETRRGGVEPKEAPAKVKRQGRREGGGSGRRGRARRGRGAHVAGGGRAHGDAILLGRERSSGEE